MASNFQLTKGQISLTARVFTMLPQTLIFAIVNPNNVRNVAEEAF